MAINMVNITINIINWIKTNPDLTTTICTIIIASVAISGVILSLHQLKAMRRSGDLQFAMQVIQELRSPHWINKFKQIYDTQGLDQIKTHKFLRNDSERVLDRLEWVGVMLARGSIPEDLTMKLIGGLPLRCWYKLGEYVKEVRKERGHYARFVEDFVRRSLKFQIAYVPREEWTKLNGKELVHELLKMDIITTRELKVLKFKRHFWSMLNHKLRMNKEEWSKLQN